MTWASVNVYLIIVTISCGESRSLVVGASAVSWKMKDEHSASQLDNSDAVTDSGESFNRASPSSQNPSSTNCSTTSLVPLFEPGVSKTTHHADGCRRRCPQVIIIGAKKAGTRALLEFLRIHPDVRAVGREVHFFDKNYHRGLEWYRRQMPMTREGQQTVEKTPSYLVTRNVPSRVRMMSKELRLLIVLRDPVTRALSDYAQASAKRRGRSLPTFEQLAFIGGGGSNSTTATVNSSWRAIQIGLYAAHMRHWMAEFSAHQLHFVSGERLVADPAGVLADVQDFLALRRLVTDKHFRFSSEKGFPCIIRDPQLAPSDVRCLGKTKGRKHPNISPDALKRLRDFFRPHNDDLYRLTNINFGWP